MLLDLRRFVLATFKGAKDDRLTGLAAEVAYFAMLSVFPGLIAVATAITSLSVLLGPGVSDAVEQSVVGWLNAVLTDEATVVVDQVQALFERDNSELFTIALLAALWSGSRGIDAVVRSIVLVADDIETRSWWRRRLLALGLLLGTVVAAAVVLSMFVVGPLLGGGVAVAHLVGAGRAFTAAWRWARLPLGTIALAGWAWVLLHVSRPGNDRWRSDLPGAITTTVTWLLVTAGLRVYLGTLGARNAVLGTLGGALIVLLWLYLLALGVLGGAEVAQQWRTRPPCSRRRRRMGSQSPTGAPPPSMQVQDLSAEHSV